MKTPQWFKSALAEQGSRLAAGDVTRDEAIDEIKKRSLSEIDDLPAKVFADFIERQLAAWEKQHRIDTSGGVGGQGSLFPEIPSHLETSPGRFAAQAVMTRKDWDAALRQAKTKADNASGYYDGIKQVHDKIRPLFTDDEQTTAQVWKPGAQPLAETGGA